ncbi:hypothetical protein Syun_015870 [Stephania yunnanensis]|uniref:Actin-related protein 5 n=1 Tax=Stephania yunnanensis TaxID=152371 RepID=A0AAP0P1Q1_9MAGN
MPFETRPLRQSDYNYFPSTCPIVIDNGGSAFRIGWAGESDPRITFRNVVQRPRHKATGETVTIVGDHDPALMKYFDCTRSFQRSAFDGNVVYQFEIMEYILDYGFERMGADGPEVDGHTNTEPVTKIEYDSWHMKFEAEQVDHPVLITECACNPVQSRAKLAELLFETYGVPSVAFGVDAAFSYVYNQQLGICDRDGIAICSGFSTSHAFPMVSGEPVFEACCRTNIGGYHVTDYLKQLLSLKYPNHVSSITWEKVEELKMEHCYVALDYFSEAKVFQKGAKEAEEKMRCWQLPWVPPPSEEPPSEEELARKAAIKEKQGQRLREMAAAKRSSRILELENEFQGLEFLLQQLENVQESDIASFLSRTGYVSRQEIESALARVTQSLRKARGEQTDIEEKMEPSTSEKYPLIDLPDNILSPEQLKEKKRQLFLKTTSEGRQRAKQKKFEEELERERQNQQDEEKRSLLEIYQASKILNLEMCAWNLSKPVNNKFVIHTSFIVGRTLSFIYNSYVQNIKKFSEKVEQRKRLKTNGSHTNGNNNISGAVGRGERLNAAQRERMRLLTTAAFDRGKGEDTFGAREEDWQLYKLMSKDNDDDDEGPDENEVELNRITCRLQEIDPTFVAKSDAGSVLATEIPRLRPLTKEDFQIILGVERFRCPEVLFQPNMINIDQAGLDEMAGISIRRLPSKGDRLERSINNSIFLTGGSCLFPGIVERVEAGIRKIRPFELPIRVVRASDPILDAWRGAAAVAAAPCFQMQTFSRQDFYEKGEDWLRSSSQRWGFGFQGMRGRCIIAEASHMCYGASPFVNLKEMLVPRMRFNHASPHSFTS